MKNREGKNLRAEELKGEKLEVLGGMNFFDENEGRLGGSHVDEMTGQPFDNTKDDSLEESIVRLKGKKVSKEANDATEEWLKKNDPNYEEEKKNWK